MATAAPIERGEYSGVEFEEDGTFFIQRMPFEENGRGYSFGGEKSFGVYTYRGSREERESYDISGSSNGSFRGNLSNRRKYGVKENLCEEGSLGSEYAAAKQYKKKVKPYRHEGVYIHTKIRDLILTLNMAPLDAVSNDEIISVEDGNKKREYRIWSPFTSKLAASIMRGIVNIYMKRGCRVLYLGTGSCSTIMHVSDIVGSEGFVYVLETSLMASTDLQVMCKLRENVKIIKGDPTRPAGYQHKLQGLVDVIFCDLAQSEQATVLAKNARYFLKYKGNFMLSIKVNGIDRTNIEATIASKLLVLIDEKLKPLESLDLQPYINNHYMINGVYLRKREINYRKFCSRLLI